MADDADFHSDAAAVHDAAWTTLEDSANKVMQRSRRFGLDEVCDRLNVDADRVRERAVQIRDEDEGGGG